MSRIKIKNFGPIKEGFREVLPDGSVNEWMDIKKVTLFIGNQGSGKSTVAKLISTCVWMEKALVRGDLKPKELEVYNRFRKKHCAYQNIHNFFKTETEMFFEGEAFEFEYRNSILKVSRRKKTPYAIPKIMYVPAERNFVSAVMQPEKLKYLPQTLYTFLEEFLRSNEEVEDEEVMPINNLKYKFDKKKRFSTLTGNDFEILLSEASSGIQSAVPLYLVSKNLANGIKKERDFTKEKLSVEDKEKLRGQLLNIILSKKSNDALMTSAVDLLSQLTRNDCFINIVEEPEQNLFPISQKEILYSLLEFNNMSTGNKLIMTTHSPYLINYLVHAIKSDEVYDKISNLSNVNDLSISLRKLVPYNSRVNKHNWVVYELNETEGSIIKLENYEGLPSDYNYLNSKMAEINETFAQILEIEDKCQTL